MMGLINLFVPHAYTRQLTMLVGTNCVHMKGKFPSKLSVYSELEKVWYKPATWVKCSLDIYLFFKTISPVGVHTMITGDVLNQYDTQTL